MIRALLALTVVFAAPVWAQPESAERRADRLRTIELNQSAASVVDRRDRSNARVREANRRAIERYQQQREQWRERVAACRAGDWNACER